MNSPLKSSSDSNFQPSFTLTNSLIDPIKSINMQEPSPLLARIDQKPNTAHLNLNIDKNIINKYQNTPNRVISPGESQAFNNSMLESNVKDNIASNF